MKLGVPCWVLGCLLAGGADGRAAPAPTAPARKRSPGQAKLPKPQATFIYQDGLLKQEVVVTFAGKKTITFAATLAGPCKRSEAGKARRMDGDSESNTDEKGNNYWVDVFEYNRDDACTISLRIDADARDKAKLVEAEDCNRACPFYQEVIMRRQD